MLSTNAPRIRTEVRVMFFDTDCGGVVHNIAYLRFVEVARTLLAEELGLGLSDMAENQKYPVVERSWATLCWSKAGSINWNACGFGAPSGLCGSGMKC
jgi:hypothetical protein